MHPVPVRILCNPVPVRILCNPFVQMDATVLAHGALRHTGVDGFMDFSTWSSICTSMFTPQGQLLGLPMTLPVDANAPIEMGTPLHLVDAQGLVFATTHATGRPFLIAPEEEAQYTLGPLWQHHPYFQQYLSHQSCWRVGTSTLTLLSNPTPSAHWHTPEQLHQMFVLRTQQQQPRYAAFQTKNALNCAHIHVLEQLHERFGALLVHPCMGPNLQSFDLSPSLRAGLYTRALPSLPSPSVLSFAPIAMRLAGPREALWHAQIHSGYGACAFAIGPNHACPSSSTYATHYDSDAAEQLIEQMQPYLHLQAVAVEQIVYSPKSGSLKSVHRIPPEEPVQTISSITQREYLKNQIPLPSWYMPSQEAQHLQQAYAKGKVILMTGLSGSGKSTVSLSLQTLFQEFYAKPLTLLDGDQVRQLLSSELGFSKEHRILNVQRMAYIAALLAQQGTSSCIAAIAPYAQARQAAYDIFTSMGIEYLTVHISTPLEVCEARDPKGLYAKARQGLIEHFTGVSDPYEPPEPHEAALSLNLDHMHPHQAARIIFQTLFDSLKPSISNDL